MEDKDQEGRIKRSDTYSLAAITKIKDNIRSVISKSSDMQKYNALEFDDGVWGLDAVDVISALTPVFSAALNADEAIVHQSLHALLRTDTVTVEGAGTVAWIMAGNQKKLQAGESVAPFINVVHVEWVPALVIGYSRCWRYGRKGGTYTFKILGGSPTSHSITEWFADDRMSKAMEYLKRVFALPVWSKYSFTEFVGMHTWMRLDPDLSQERGRPKASHMECTSSFKKRNRDLYKSRLKPCIIDPSRSQWDCCNCGYGMYSCARATHVEDYEVLDCPTCNKPGWFIEGGDRQRCLRCQEQLRLRIGKERNKHG